jgi:hypothetical protein
VTVISTYDWIVGIAKAQVLVNPARPDVGRRTTTQLETPPQPDPEETNKLVQALDPEVGEDRATAQQTPPDPSDPTPDTGTRTEDPRVPVAPNNPQNPGEGDCDQSLFSILNPFNIAKTMACFLKALFIPKGNHWGSLRADFDSGIGTIVGHPAAVLFASWGALDQPGGGNCEGPTVQIPGGPGWGGFEFQPISACSGVPETVASLVRPIMLAVIYVGAIIGSAKLIGASFGIATPGAIREYSQ